MLDIKQYWNSVLIICSFNSVYLTAHYGLFIMLQFVILMHWLTICKVSELHLQD
jgi:uncharacterized protein (DUF2062 family)